MLVFYSLEELFPLSLPATDIGIDKDGLIIKSDLKSTGLVLERAGRWGLSFNIE
jgi:hypothetical protein